MKKISFLFLIVLATLFVSCSKEDATISEKLEISYSDTIEVFSADKLSSMIIAVSSNNNELLEDMKNSLMIDTDIDADEFISSINSINLKSEELNETSSVQSNISADVSVSIIKINTDLKVIGLCGKDVDLKSVPLIKTYTHHHDCVESEYDFFVKYKDGSGSQYGIDIYMGHKDCWLCSWEMPGGYTHVFGGEEEYANPWNRHKSVYKLGADIVTDLGRVGNYEIVLYER